LPRIPDTPGDFAVASPRDLQKTQLRSAAARTT
jgi:hypothetical protein